MISLEQAESNYQNVAEDATQTETGVLIALGDDRYATVRQSYDEDCPVLVQFCHEDSTIIYQDKIDLMIDDDGNIVLQQLSLEIEYSIDNYRSSVACGII